MSLYQSKLAQVNAFNAQMQQVHAISGYFQMNFGQIH